MVPLDITGASKKGLDTAINLAKLTNAKITCITILVIYPTLVTTVLNYKKFLTTKAEKMLEEKEKYCKKQNIKCETKVLVGNPTAQIINFAEKQNADLIVIGSKGLGGIKGKVFGSIPNSVVHGSKISVLVVK